MSKKLADIAHDLTELERDICAYDSDKRIARAMLATMLRECALEDSGQRMTVRKIQRLPLDDDDNAAGRGAVVRHG